MQEPNPFVYLIVGGVAGALFGLVPVLASLWSAMFVAGCACLGALAVWFIMALRQERLNLRGAWQALFRSDF